MNTDHSTREPSVGRAHQPTLPPDALAAWTDPLLLARKGRLYLLCRSGLDSQTCFDLYRRYYTDTCFDVLPSLQAALAGVFAEYPGSRPQFLLVVVLLGLDVLALGTAEAALFLVRDEETRVLLGAHPEMPHARPVIGPAGTLYAVQRRLGIDDSLVLTTYQAAGRLHPPFLRRALASRNPTDHAAALIARAAGKAGSSNHEPVTVIRIPGFSPVPEFAGSLPPVEPPPPKLRHRGSARFSPVLIALLIAVVAVAATFAIERPTISVRTWEDLALQMLTPEAQRQTATAARATANVESSSATPLASGASAGTPEATELASLSGTPSPTATRVAREGTPTNTKASPRATRQVAVPSPTARNYPVPQLLSPREGQDLRGDLVVLRWAWSGNLAENEYFDVRMWREGAAKASIAWTRDLEYRERDAREGWYHWTIVVVRGQNGVIERELSREPQSLSFQLIGGPDKQATPEPTLVRPTRVNP
jgi:hypothetical protein